MIKEGKCPRCGNVLESVTAEIYEEGTSSSYVDIKVECDNCDFEAYGFIDLSSLEY